MRFAFALFGVFLMATLAAGEVIPGQYLVEMEGRPAGKNAAARQAMRRTHAGMEPRLSAVGGRMRASLTATANVLLVDAPGVSAGDLLKIPGVINVYPVEEMRIHMDSVPSLVGAVNAWRNYGGEDRAGEGVKIGIIDTGIDHHHPAFRDASMKPPDGYPKVDLEEDLPYTTGKIIVARSYARLDEAMPGDKTPADLAGHGTSVAMAAAGVIHETPVGRASGLAPKAWLGNYRANRPGNSGTFRTDAVMKAFDDAVADGMDVINLSLGSALSTRPEDDLFTRMVERAAAQGVIVVVSAGNEGPDSMTIGSRAVPPLVIAAGSTRHGRILTSTFRLGEYVARAVPGSGSPAATPAVTAPLADVEAIAGNGLACAALPQGSMAGRIALILRGDCTFEVKLNNAAAAGAVAALVYTNSGSPDAITMAVGNASLPAAMLSHQDGVELRSRLAAGVDIEGTLRFALSAFPADSGRLSTFSSIGPNTDFTIKPDLVTIGQDVYTAQAGGGYRSVQGTSFSAPVVAGAAAVVKWARPGLTVEQYRSLLINSASWYDAPTQHRGAGSLNVDAAANTWLAASPALVSFGAAGIRANPTQRITVSNLGTLRESYSILVNPTKGVAAPSASTTAIDLEPGRTGSFTVTLAADDLPPGETEGLIVIRGSVSGSEIRVPYWHGVPSHQPSRISVVQSASSGTVSATVRDAIMFRILDDSGLPVNSIEPEIIPETEGSEVVRIRSLNGLYPAVWSADLRLAAAPGPVRFKVRAGAIERTLSITAR
jgi:subtilisin family serine protease